MRSLLVLAGPRLDLLGTRQPEIYGSVTLADIEHMIADECGPLGLAPTFVQSAREDELIEAISAARPEAIIINPAAFTHFSYRLADALREAAVPVVEVHLSNIHAREPYRRLSVVSPVARAVICGLGADGYRDAVRAVARMLSAS